MSVNSNNTPDMEDISSTSKKIKKNENPAMIYADGIYKNLGNVVKAISFILCIGIIILSFIVAFFVFSKTAFSIALSLCIIILGTVLAAIVFFPLYAIGHIVCQNNEILKRLNK